MCPIAASVSVGGSPGPEAAGSAAATAPGRADRLGGRVATVDRAKGTLCRRIGDPYAAGMPIEPYVFVAGILVVVIASALLVLGVIESGPAALIGIIGIGLIALSSSLRRRRS